MVGGFIVEKNRVCELLKIKYPIFQGGMARIADASLASAVSEAGGLGIITGAAPTDWVREQIKRAKEMTEKPFGVNIMLMAENADEIADLIKVQRYYQLNQRSLKTHDELLEKICNFSR